MKVLLAAIAALLVGTLISYAQSPGISSFGATDSNPIYGKETTLNWTTSNATSVSITPDIGAVSSSGSLTVLPLETTTYNLVARKGGASAFASVTVVVTPPIGVTADEFTLQHRILFRRLPLSQPELSRKRGECPEWCQCNKRRLHHRWIRNSRFHQRYRRELPGRRILAGRVGR